MFAFFFRAILFDFVYSLVIGVAVVSDTTSVNDYRATAHEIGHLFGLNHTSDSRNLMFRGANGEILNVEEIDTVIDFFNKSGARRP